jgi:hypothetical protein
VKLHTEVRPWPDGPKCLWAPFGTYPAAKPHHGLQTLWPEPEEWTGAAVLRLCGGELKALAYLSEGLPATSPTCGENGMPAWLVARLKACRPGQIALVYDSDAAGRKWRDGLLRDLGGAGLCALACTFGTRKSKGVEHDSDLRTLPAAV